MVLLCNLSYSCWISFQSIRHQAATHAYKVLKLFVISTIIIDYISNLITITNCWLWFLINFHLTKPNKSATNPWEALPVLPFILFSLSFCSSYSWALYSLSCSYAMKRRVIVPTLLKDKALFLSVMQELHVNVHQDLLLP